MRIGLYTSIYGSNIHRNTTIHLIYKHSRYNIRTTFRRHIHKIYTTLRCNKMLEQTHECRNAEITSSHWNEVNIIDTTIQRTFNNLLSTTTRVRRHQNSQKHQPNISSSTVLKFLTSTPNLPFQVSLSTSRV